MTKLLSLFLVLISPLVALGQEQCGTFDQSELVFAQVSKIKGKKGEKAYFYKHGGKCPDGPNCKTRAFVLPEDLVMVSSPTDYSGCVRYVSEKGVETTGWIMGKHLNYDAVPLPLASWAGTWRDESGDYEINIKQEGTQLKVSGVGAFDMGNGTVNNGSFEGKSRPNNGILVIEEGECKVSIANLKTRLYVAATLACGGMNVVFDGTYRKSWQ